MIGVRLIKRPIEKRVKGVAERAEEMSINDRIKIEPFKELSAKR